MWPFNKHMAAASDVVGTCDGRRANLNPVQGAQTPLVTKNTNTELQYIKG